MSDRVCTVDDGTHHSSDLIDVFRGSVDPVTICGKHAMSLILRAHRN